MILMVMILVMLMMLVTMMLMLMLPRYPGAQALHFVACTAVLYLTLLVAGGTVASVVFSFIFQMGYLIVGETGWTLSSSSHDFSVTVGS